MFLIGCDIGTSGTKTVLFDEAGNTVASALREYPLYQPKNGWAEQDPRDWWKACAEGIKEVILKAEIKPEAIAAVGLSGQMHGLVMLDKNDEIIRPSIIWCDQRTGEAAEHLTDLVGKEELVKITANPAMTGFTASKILWVKENEPENFEKCAKFMLPKDYVRYMLTGEFATEVSDASGMQLMDVPGRCWSKKIIAKLELDESRLGRIYESCEVTGKVSEKAARETGLAPGTVVVGGAGDQAAGAVGNGIVREGVISATIGTSGVVFAHTDNISIDPKGRVHTLCHAVPGAWHIMGVTQAAALSFNWMRDSFFPDIVSASKAIGRDKNALIDEAAAKSPIGANGLIYLPYLMGERTPHLDPDCRGVLFGLSAMHQRNDIARSVLEGVVFSLCDCLNIIRDMTGSEIGKIFASGGGAVSPLWRKMMADVFGAPIYRNNSKEGGALGVAILAGVGAGLYKSVPEACDALISEKDITANEEENTARYAKYYNIYTHLYDSLRDDFKLLKQ